MCISARHKTIDDDDVTVITSNATSATTKLYRLRALLQLSQAPVFAGATFALKTRNAIADSKATQVFIMEGIPFIDKRCMMNPLEVSLLMDAM